MTPSRSAEITEIRGQLVRLRPFIGKEIDAAWQGLERQDESAHPRVAPQDHRPMPSEPFRRRLLRSGTVWRGCLDLAIDRRGRLIGLIQARSKPRQTLPPGVFEIGIVLFRRKDRGRGYGRDAVALLTTWLFDAAGAERVQAGTGVGNTAMRTVLEHLGFRLEGVQRGYGSLSDGSREDRAMYAALRREWRAHN